LGEYLHQVTRFPKAKHDDQADSTSQALDCFKQLQQFPHRGFLDELKEQAEKLKASKRTFTAPSFGSRGRF